MSEREIMRNEEIRFSNLAAAHATIYSYSLEDCVFDPSAQVYRLIFKNDHDGKRIVTVFADQFNEAVIQNNLGLEIIANIDEALQDK